jgi:hypothetical protein
MPSALISIYLNDEDYIKYAQNKEVINAKMREYLKKQIKE